MLAIFLKLNSFYKAFRKSPYREVIWPIKGRELIKFLPMAALMFTILLNQNIVRIIKDSMVMTMVGPEVISFIKLWGEMPAGLLFVVLYSKMCNVMTTEKAFTIIVSCFLIFFSVFGFYIFPNHHLFHPDPELIAGYIQALPNLKWFIIMWSKWCFILFYIMGELWPIIVFSLLFWQLANKVTKTEEAGRFYTFFSLFGQTNLLISGTIVVYFSGCNHCFSWLFENLTNREEVTLKSLTIILVLTGLICLALHQFIVRKVMTNPELYKPRKSSKQILNLSLRQSFKTILTSPYLGLICWMIIAYGVAVNLIEGLWLFKVREMYPTMHKFMKYQGIVLFWTGIFTMICAFLGSSIIRKFGWFWGAILTPAMICGAGSMFFSFVLVQDNLDYLLPNWRYMTPLAIIVFIGGLQNVLGKGAKYSLFDATKEMAYIPLDDELKVKGKAAVDVVGTKIGKSVGALTQFLTFTIFPMANYDDIAGFLMSFFVIICISWLICVRMLGHKYNEQVRLREAEDALTA